jgi:hypothetical protein
MVAALFTPLISRPKVEPQALSQSPPLGRNIEQIDVRHELLSIHALAGSMAEWDNELRRMSRTRRHPRWTEAVHKLVSDRMDARE